MWHPACADRNESNEIYQLLWLLHLKNIFMALLCFKILNIEWQETYFARMCMQHFVFKCSDSLSVVRLCILLFFFLLAYLCSYYTVLEKLAQKLHECPKAAVMKLWLFVRCVSVLQDGACWKLLWLLGLFPQRCKQIQPRVILPLIIPKQEHNEYPANMTQAYSKWLRSDLSSLKTNCILGKKKRCWSLRCVWSEWLLLI